MQFERDLTDLIKEERSAVRHFKAADLLGDGSSECPLFMAEQFALKQTGRSRCAIQLDERPVVPPAEPVNRTLLAGSRFTENQHGGIGRRDDPDLFQDNFQRRAFADDLFKVLLRADLFLEIQLLFRQLALS